MSIEHGYEYRVLNEPGIWKYGGLLPSIRNKISLGEGSTPLIKSRRLFDGLVFFKDEGRNPTGSFRDRSAALIVSDALDQGVDRIVLASDGNMGVSVSAYSAAAGLKTTVYVPPWIEDEKIMLIKAFNANVVIRDQGLDELLRIVDKRCRSGGLYNASSTYNILSLEGLKTIALEIHDQLHVVKEIVVPLGSGLTLLSIYHGYMELSNLGLVDKIPKLVGVETCGNPTYSSIILGSVKCGEEPFPGLSYRKPLIMDTVIEIIEKYGEIITVNRRETIEAAKKLAWMEGLFIEPSSAVALAGSFKLGLEDYSVIVLTGHGLKGPSMYSKPSRTRSTTLFPSSTKRMIIDLLRENPGLTGYEVWRRLGLNISVQAVYQHLKDLVDRGFVKYSVVDGLKRYYVVEY